MKRIASALGIAAAGVVVVYAGWRLQRWRQAEEEEHLRKIHTLSGTVKRYSEFRSEILGLERRVWVYLPPMYDDEPGRRFPVLYMHDGQNVFDGATAFLAGKEWEADETAERLIEEGRVEPLIIVAVDNGGESRFDEYAPVADARYGAGGQAEPYGRMLVEELKPWVDENFRTRTGRNDTALAGSSLGGLVSLWIGFSYPETFGKIAALSTTVFWGDNHIIHFIERLPTKPPTRLWVDAGSREGSAIRDGARRLRDTLLERGWEEGVDLSYVEVVGGTHDEPGWAKRLPAVLEFLFPAEPDASDEIDG